MGYLTLQTDYRSGKSMVTSARIRFLEVQNVDRKTLYLAIEWCQMAGVHNRRASLRLASVRPATSNSTGVMMELECILCVRVSLSVSSYVRAKRLSK